MKWPVEKKIAAGFGLLLTILIIIGVNSFQSALKFTETSRLETKSRMILKKLEIVLTEITNAETGQRGYIITGDERYLEPYHAAVANIDREVEELSKLIRDNPDHQRKLDALKPLLAEKLAGLNERIGLRKNKGFEAAAQEVRSGKGRIAMDKIRKIITEMENGEKELLKQKAAEAEASSNRTIFIIIFGSSLAFVIVGIASFITRKELILRKKTEDALKKAYGKMEQKVEERTTELHAINESLQREITERKKAEEALKNSEQKLVTLLSNLPGYAYRCYNDRDWTLEFISEGVYELTGYHADDYLVHRTVTCGEKIHPDDRDRVWNEVQAALEKCQQFEIVYRIIAKSNEEKWVWERGRGIYSPECELLHIEGFVTDITVRKKADEALKRRLEFEKTIANISSRFLEVSDIDKAINAALRDMGILNGASRAYLFLFSEDETSMDNTHEWCKEGVTPHIDNLKNLPTEMFPWWMHKLHNREVIYITDVSKMPEEAKDEKKILEGQDIKSLLVIPLISADKLAGFIGFDNVEETGEWGEEDLALLRVSSELIGNILERKKAEEKIRVYQEQLQSLASQLSLVEEHERHRIATELHDHIGQTLALCKIKLGALRESVSSALAESVDGIRHLIDQTIQFTRSLTSELSPPILYELGFEAAVEWLGEQILSRQDIHFHFNDDGQPKPMDDEARILLFQAVRELLVNVVNHSQARNSSVYIRRDGNNIQIKVEDDGIGFDISKLDSYLRTKAFGIFGIRERLNSIGGHLNVESEPGKGTRVTIVAPLK